MKRIVESVKCFVVLTLMFITIVACSGGSGTTRPQTPVVQGGWSFVGNLSSNTCSFLEGSPGFQIGSFATQSINVVQDNLNVTATVTGGNIFSNESMFTGTVVGAGFTLAESNPNVSTAGGCAYVIGGGMDLPTIEENSGDGSMNLNVVSNGGDCSFLGTLPCSVVYTGSWIQTNSAKHAGVDAGKENSMALRLEQLMKTK